MHGMNFRFNQIYLKKSDVFPDIQTAFFNDRNEDLPGKCSVTLIMKIVGIICALLLPVHKDRGSAENHFSIHLFVIAIFLSLLLIFFIQKRIYRAC